MSYKGLSVGFKTCQDRLKQGMLANRTITERQGGSKKGKNPEALEESSGCSTVDACATSPRMPAKGDATTLKKKNS